MLVDDKKLAITWTVLPILLLKMLDIWIPKKRLEVDVYNEL